MSILSSHPAAVQAYFSDRLALDPHGVFRKNLALSRLPKRPRPSLCASKPAMELAMIAAQPGPATLAGPACHERAFSPDHPMSPDTCTRILFSGEKFSYHDMVDEEYFSSRAFASCFMGSGIQR